MLVWFLKCDVIGIRIEITCSSFQYRKQRPGVIVRGCEVHKEV